MEDIDVRVIIRKLMHKWYWFAASLTFTLGLAFLYLQSTEKEYKVESTLQLKDESLNAKGTSEEKFINGFDLLSSDSELEDEIGILTSFTNIQKAIQQEGKGAYVSIYQLEPAWGPLKKLMAKPQYPSAISILLDTTQTQLLNVPIYLKIEGDQYHLEIEAEENELYDFGQKEVKAYPLAIESTSTHSFAQAFESDFLNFSIRKNFDLEEGEYYFVIHHPDELTEAYRDRLTHDPISENSNILKLGMQGSTPARDRVFLGHLAEVYIQHNLEKENQLGLKTIEFIDFQLAKVADSLQKTEGNLQDFRATNQVIDIGVTSQNLTEQLFKLEEQQAQLSVQNEYYRYIANYLQMNDEVGDVVAPSSVGIQDELLNNLLLQLSKLSEEKVSKDYSSSENNPLYKVLLQKIQATKTALIENINNLVNSNELAMKKNDMRVQDLQQNMSRLPQSERNLIDIQRRFTFNDNIYNYLIQKKAEAGIAIASNIPDKAVVDPPRQISKKPVAPNQMFILLLALISGLIAPAGLIFIQDFFQSQVESEEQLAYWTDLPVIEHIAQLKEKEKKDLFAGETYLAHTFRYIRHHVDFLRLSQGVKTVGVTSAKSGEGKTFCALNLAISFASTGRKTLLMDADLHHPMIARQLGLRKQLGLSDYLIKGVQQIIVETDYKGMDILTAGTPEDNPSDLFSHAQFPALMAKLKEQYEVIILDTPPVGLIADYLLLSKHIDYTLLVVRHETSTKDEVQRLDKLIKRNQLHGGIIYNGTKTTDNYKGYYKKVAKKKKA